MPKRNPDADRWGGPGASKEDRSKPKPDPLVKDADDPDRYSRHAKRSGGGGETDVHHAHAANRKRRFQSSDAESRKD
ncbi:MAG TPA: hypothetical protein VG407_02340 [Caulobacteraceae bacterium]|jgi:hypothetical protein|nr:hypothetical protein [Caulobacteraceae bacterium]